MESVVGFINEVVPQVREDFKYMLMKCNLLLNKMTSPSKYIKNKVIYSTHTDYLYSYNR